MEALAEDQRAIKDILEEERLRVEETLQAASAARKAMDDSPEERFVGCIHLHMANVTRVLACAHFLRPITNRPITIRPITNRKLGWWFIMHREYITFVVAVVCIVCIVCAEGP